MTDFIIRAIIDPNGAAPGIAKLEGKLEALNRAGRNVGSGLGSSFRSAGQQGVASINAVDARARALRGTFLSLGSVIRGTFAAGGLALGARELIRMSDAAIQLTNRLRLVTTSEQNLIAVRQRLFEISQATRQSFEDTVEVYARFALQSRRLGIDQAQLLTIIENLNKAVALSGATTIEASNAIRQLTQGLGSGTLRGEELRSVFEQLPLVADIIAKELGVATDQLYALGKAGQITSRDIANALLAVGDDIDRAFAGINPTISQSFTVLRNSFIQVLTSAEEASGGISLIAQAIIFVADNLNVVIPLVVVFLGLLVVTKLVAIAGAVLQIANAFRALGVFLVRNPVFLAAALAALAGFLAFKDDITSFIDGIVEQLGGVPEAAEAAFGPFGTIAEEGIGDANAALQDLLNSATGTADGFEAVGESARTAMRSAANSTEQLTRTLINANQEVVKLAYNVQQIRDLPGVSSNVVGGAAFQAAQPHNARRASGGSTSGGSPYLVGERGPELIFPTYRGYVANAMQTRAMLGGVPGRAAGGFISPSTSPFDYSTSGPEFGKPISHDDPNWRRVWMGTNPHVAVDVVLKPGHPDYEAPTGSGSGGGRSVAVDFAQLLRSATDGVALTNEAYRLQLITQDIHHSLLGFLDGVGNIAANVVNRKMRGNLEQAFAQAAAFIIPGADRFAEDLVGSNVWDAYIAKVLPPDVIFANQLKNIFGGGVGMSGGFGGYATKVGDLYANPNVYAGAFANGGSFRVPGSGSTDSKRVVMDVTPGERVSVSRKNDSGGNKTFNFHVNINVEGVTDAESFRRNETQVLAGVLAQLEQVKREI